MANRGWGSWVAVGALLVLTVASAAWSVSTAPEQRPLQKQVAIASAVPSKPSTVANIAPISTPTAAGRFGIKPPPITVGTGPPPAVLEASDLITGAGQAVETGDTATVQYVEANYATPGTVAVTTWGQAPFVFILGDHQLVTGWDEGLVGMRVGGRRELIVPPKLAYEGLSDATVVFVIDLLGVVVSTTTTLASQVPGACPPGCSLPSDYDAITVLASSAELVAIVTVRSSQAAPDEAAAYTTDKILQGNVVYGPGPEAYVAIGSPMIYGTSEVVAGKSYLVFVSFNRGGTCLSALFSYDSETNVATLIGSDAEFEAPRLPLDGGRVVVIPATITLAEVEQRMYPTGGPVYPTDSGESWCPGP
jgi:peptidylprolyl isomerase